MNEIKEIFIKYKIQIFLVLCLILVISRLTYHSDVFNVAVNTAKVVQGDYSLSQKIESGATIYTSYFPPMFHFVDSLFYCPFTKLGIYKFDLNNVPASQLLSVGFLLKLRYLVVFILSLMSMITISRIYEKNTEKRDNIFLLWLLCPVLIFIPFSWGNNDIYPTLLLLLFLLFAFKKKYFWAMLFLGLSASTKNFALFLIIPAAIILSNKSPKKTLVYAFVGFFVYLVPLLFFFKTSSTFITGGGEGLFILQKKLFDGPLLFPLAYFVILIFLVVKQKLQDSNINEVLVNYCFSVLSLFYLTSFYIPHWFLWIMPFFILTAYRNRKLFYLYILINTTFFIGIFSWSRNIDMNLFSFAFPIINKVMTLGEFVSTYLLNFKLFDIVYSLFFAAFICYIYLLFIENDKDSSKKNVSKNEINTFSIFPLAFFLAISFVFIFGMVSIRNAKNRDWYDLGLFSRSQVVGPVNVPGQIYQTFMSPKDKLKGINIFFSTYEKKINSPYKLVVYDEFCKNKIVESNIRVDKIIDNAYCEVLFQEIENSKGKEYCFTIEPTEKQVNTPITLQYSRYNSYASGELFLNSKQMKNEDVVFQLIYPLK